VDEAYARDHDLRLPALQVADEVPLEAVAEYLLLAYEVVSPVLPEEVGAGLGERGDLVRLVVLAGYEYPRLPRPASAPLQRRLYLFAHAREVVPDGGRRSGRHDGTFATAARLRPVNGPCLRWE
jgi:hypothetical protein